MSPPSPIERLLAQTAKVVASVAVSAFFIWLTLRRTDLSEILAALRSANYLYLLPYVAVTASIHFIRVWRWGILLEPVGRPSFARLNSAGAIGFMALVILPFRLGELARPLLIAEKGRIRRSAAMASVVVERVVDGLSMAVVLVVALLFADPVTSDRRTIAWARGGGFIVFGFFLSILAFLVVAHLKRELAVRLIHALASPLSASLARRTAGMMDAFIGALKVVPDRRKIALFGLLTLAYWGINGAGMALLSRGFGLELSAVQAFAVLGVLVVGVMIPAGPGMLGTFQGAVILGMNLFFPDQAVQGAVQAFAWILWAAQFGQQVLFGLFFLVRGHVSFGSLIGPGAEEEADALGGPPESPASPAGRELRSEKSALR